MGNADKRRRRALAQREFSRRAAMRQDAPVPTITPQRLTALEKAGIVARNLIPLLMIVAFGWSLGQYLLLSVFSLTFSVTSIAMVGISVGHRESMHASALDALGSWLSVLAAGILVSLLLTAMFGWVVAVMAWQGDGVLFDCSLVISALAIVLAAVPGMHARFRADAASGLSEQQRMMRDRPEIDMQLASAAAILLGSFFAAQWGRFGVVVLALAVTVLSLVRDLRPDLLRRLLPPPERV
jgi:hypothetical protein